MADHIGIASLLICTQFADGYFGHLAGRNHYILAVHLPIRLAGSLLGGDLLLLDEADERTRPVGQLHRAGGQGDVLDVLAGEGDGRFQRLPRHCQLVIRLQTGLVELQHGYRLVFGGWRHF